MGSRSNVVLVSAADNTISSCAYQVSSSKSVRPLQTSSQYSPPPPQEGDAPSLNLSYEQWVRKLTLVPSYSADKALVAAFKGVRAITCTCLKVTVSCVCMCLLKVSPVLARRMFEAVNISSSTEIQLVPTEQLHQVYGEYLALLTRVHSATQFVYVCLRACFYFWHSTHKCTPRKEMVVFD
jgi:predicted ribosome quality control (RQC) complex YloA/Tae2 family protein